MEDSPASELIIETVANLSGIDPLELPPIFETIDPDSLDTLIREMDEGEISFDYADYTISVNSQKVIELEERSKPHRKVQKAALYDN